MSSDNGIYCASFPKLDGSFEYRVAHCQNIEECFPGCSLSDEMIDLLIVIKFGDSKVFDNKDDATTLAFDMAKECTVLEYGVCELDFDKPFPAMTVEEANKKFNDFWDKRM